MLMLDRQPELEPEVVHAPCRDPAFDAWRLPKSDRAWTLVGEVVNVLGDYEAHFSLRHRARRERDEETYLRMVAGLVCGLVHRVLHDDENRPMAISLSKEALSRLGRYRSPLMVKALPDAIAQLASTDLSYVEAVWGAKGNPFTMGRRTTICAGSALIDRIDAYGIELSDLAQDLDQETIVLKRSREGHWDAGNRIDYRDGATTRRLRGEMRAINEWLADADLDCSRLDPHRASPDVSDRLLRRYFNNATFEDGGRLFGGFWQPMRKADRIDGIRINGEPVTTLDYGQMAARILYGMAGAQPREGDLYAVPGLEQWRDGVKLLFNALLFVDGDLRVRPKGSAKLLPHGKVQGFTKAIMDHHAPIAPLLRTMIGPKATRVESDIIVDVLLRLRDTGVVALPVHDAVIVPVSHRERVHSVMSTVFKEQTGCNAVVTEE